MIGIFVFTLKNYNVLLCFLIKRDVYAHKVYIIYM